MKKGRPRRIRSRFATRAFIGGALTISLVAALVVPAVADGTTINAPAPIQITLDMSECGVMYLNTVGSCIISLQYRMNWAVGTKATQIKPDGVYGPATQALVETFQREYVPSVIPNGMFGDRSRAALKQWFIEGATAQYSSGVPCNPALGWGCDADGVDPGWFSGNVGVVEKTFICRAVGTLAGEYGTFVGIVCSTTLS